MFGIEPDVCAVAQKNVPSVIRSVWGAWFLLDVGTEFLDDEVLLPWNFGFFFLLVLMKLEIEIRLFVVLVFYYLVCRFQL